MRLEVLSLEVEPLSVPLVDPFVIATGRVDQTRSALVRVQLRAEGRTAFGLGEAAALPPVTREDQPDVLLHVRRAASMFVGRTLELGRDFTSLEAMLDAALEAFPVSRSGVEMALLDAIARLKAVPLHALLSTAAARPVVTDITLPILPPARMAELARSWWELGFRAFKLKVGRALSEDLEALAAIHGATPAATLRVDANGGFSAEDALAFLRAAREKDFRIECFEQPCAPDDVEGMAEVTRVGGVTVIADESVKRLSDLQVLRAHRAASGVNLKVAKCGGLLEALRIGRAARTHGLALMVGGMVETRLGMTAATHLVTALGGVDFADLDTAWLLKSDPFVGGYQETGPRYLLPGTPGLGVSWSGGRD